MDFPRFFVLASLCLALAGCGDSAPEPQPAPSPRLAHQNFVDPLEEAMSRELLFATPEQYNEHRKLLAEVRRGDSAAGVWPGCNALTRDYRQLVEQSQTLIALHETLGAAAVDDAILCNEPNILPITRDAIRMRLPQVVQSTELAQNPERVIEWMEANPPRRAMDGCWIKALREARMGGVKYTQAYNFADQACATPLPAPEA